MIKVLTTGFGRLGVLKGVLDCSRIEEINGENTLDLTTLLDEKNSALITETSVLEYKDDYFDLAVLNKEVGEDGIYIIDVEAEHVSYRLNHPDYDVDYFTEEGTPSYILGKILENTGFTVGSVEKTEVITYSAQEAKSRRQLLIEFAEYSGMEIIFSKMVVSMVTHLGSASPKPLVTGKNVSVIKKTFNRRDLDDDGNPVVSYSCSPITTPDDGYSLGDDILLINQTLGIKEALRLVRYKTNPYNPTKTTLTFSNKIEGITGNLYRIETQTVSKDKFYNGTRIGPTYGFEAVRSDNLARAYFRSDGFKMQSGDGTGVNWLDRLYYELDTETMETNLVFDGKLSAGIIEVLSTLITPNLTAGKATIAELTVDRLETSDKVKNYLDHNTDDVNFIRIQDEVIEFVTSSTDGSQEEHVRNRNLELLYWTDMYHKGSGTLVTDYPVMQYVYTDLVKMRVRFRMVDGNYVPVMEVGAGFGNPLDPDRGKGFIFKDSDGLCFEYVKSNGDSLILRLGESGVRLPNEYYDRLSDLDFYNNGFSATYTNESVAYTWVKDGLGRITQLMDTQTGTVIPVSWNAGDM